MRIFVVDTDNVVEYATQQVESENDIEDFLEKHIEVLDPDIFLIGRQVPAGGKRIDLMGIDREGNVVIIELKRGWSKLDVISQVLRYAAWARNAGYNDLSNIAKKHLEKNIDLHNLFQSRFKSVPDTWNANQTIYVVAERINNETRDVANYLNTHGVDIRCVELNFYKGDGKEIVKVDFVESLPLVGMGDAAKKAALNWDDMLGIADEEHRSMVLDFIAAVKDKLSPLADPQSGNKHYYLKITEKDKKNRFGVIVCHKKSAYVSFGVDPKTFPYDDNPEVRSNYRWFFSSGTERRIVLTRSNFNLILQCLEHARDVTKNL